MMQLLLQRSWKLRGKRDRASPISGRADPQAEHGDARSDAPPPMYAASTFPPNHEIIVKIARGHPIPPKPTMLEPNVNQADYETGMDGIVDYLNKFHWSWAHRIGLVACIVFTLFVPWPLIVIVRNIILKRDNDAIDAAERSGLNLDQAKIHPGDFILSKVVILVIFFGLFTLFWLPYYLWHLRAMRVLNATTSRISKNSLRWELRYIAPFRGRADVAIGLPKDAFAAGLWGGGANPYALEGRGWLPPYKAQP